MTAATTDAPKPIAGYEAPAPFEDGDIAHWVYRRGDGPVVVIMHELPGLTPKCVGLCNEVAAAGFRVVVPLMFGPPERFALVRNFAGLCVNREFHLFAKRQSSPIVTWLRALCRAEMAGQDGKPVGLIGMCLTGNFALGMVADDAVCAPVAAQPSLPVFAPRALALSDGDLAAATTRAKALGPGSIIGFRYERDALCKAAKFDCIREAFGASTEEVITERVVAAAAQDTLDEPGYRKLTGNGFGTNERDLSPVSQDRMQRLAEYL